ncbi:MAG: hypothetical protein K2I85_04565 [Alistipes sp.]|nr:hypothetical protein [Alistipes sp.]
MIDAQKVKLTLHIVKDFKDALSIRNAPIGADSGFFEENSRSKGSAAGKMHAYEPKVVRAAGGNIPRLRIHSLRPATAVCG